MRYMRLLLIIISVIFISACGNIGSKEQNNTGQPAWDNVGEFSATDQNGDEFNVTDLKGQWWVADFIFTNCTTVCLPMTANMKNLQGQLEEESLEDVRLVSFSVDPDRDTPEVLTDYANEYGADLNRWTFVTGYDFETIKNYSIKTFKNLVDAPPEGDDQVTHAVYFFLVNPDGDIVSHYSGMKADQMEQIVTDIKNFQ